MQPGYSPIDLPQRVRRRLENWWGWLVDREAENGPMVHYQVGMHVRNAMRYEVRRWTDVEFDDCWRAVVRRAAMGGDEVTAENAKSAEEGK